MARYSSGGAFASATTFLSHVTFQMLKKKAEDMGLPVSKVIAIAIDNEMDSPNPFNYLCQMPSSTYIDGAYMDEAMKIYKYLKKFPYGVARDTLVMHRRDMGILNKDAFMFGYRELLEKDQAEEIPVPPSSKFKYPPGYRYTKLKNVSPNDLKLSKKERLLQEKAALDAQLAKLEGDPNGQD